MFTVYVIESLNFDFRYVGFTSSLTRRLHDHNRGYNKSTKHYKPFNLIYTESCETSTIARKREKFFKSTRGRNFLREYLENEKACTDEVGVNTDGVGTSSSLPSL